MKFWLVVGVPALAWVAWALVTGGWELWKEHRRPWWRRTDGDYLDLRPRQVGRRRWW